MENISDENGDQKGESGDWSETAADSIEDFTARTRERVTSPLKQLAKIFAFIPLALLFLAALISLLTIGVFRVIDSYLPQPSWLVHFIMGGGFILIGLILWLRRPRLSSS